MGLKWRFFVSIFINKDCHFWVPQSKTQRVPKSEDLCLETKDTEMGKMGGTSLKQHGGYLEPFPKPNSDCISQK